MLHPDSSPISAEQLAAEIKGIYDGLVTVETKCIDIDAALASDKGELSVEQWQALVRLNRTLLYKHHDFLMARQHLSATDETELDVEQWQALITLHRTLLYEHHDFLMATQYPNASNNLERLASKYRMPAIMWKHGIHAFLEVLRHRRPDSREYMLAFITLAYQMMALLFETVPCLTDTWIECFGDLARYRMAIEEGNREVHAISAGMAALWYTLASDRHPEVGRLYHYLGILECPGICKPASYTKGVACSIPSVNARDSMATFCKPSAQEEHLTKFDRDWMKDAKASDPNATTRKKTNADAPQCFFGVGLCRNPHSGSGSREHTWRMENSGLWESDEYGGQVGKDLDAVLSWTAWFVGTRFIDFATGTRRGAHQQGPEVPLPKPRIDFGRSWCSTRALKALLRTVEDVLGSTLRSGNPRAWWSLLFFGCPRPVFGHPVADVFTIKQEPNNSGFPHWIWPLIPTFLALVRGLWNIIKPMDDLRASSFWTNYEIVSGGAFLVAKAVVEHHRMTNLTILGCWLFFWLGNVVTRYRLTGLQYRKRYFPLMLSAGALVAFAAAAVFVKLTGTGSIARQGLDGLPLGLSASAWGLYILWSNPEQARSNAYGNSRMSDETLGSELDRFIGRGTRSLPSTFHHRQNTAVATDNAQLEEQVSVHHFPH